MGKIDMLLYQMSPSIPENISNPNGLSLSLKCLPTIKTNLSILILAYPEWFVLPTAIFYNFTSICGYLLTLRHSLSLGLSAVMHTRPFFLFHINMTTVYVFDY
jgi:hypothetical protein